MSQRGKKQGPGAGNTVAVCTRLAQPVAEELGLQLWDVRFVKEGADWYLRFFIDREGGVTIDDCWMRRIPSPAPIAWRSAPPVWSGNCPGRSILSSFWVGR